MRQLFKVKNKILLCKNQDVKPGMAHEALMLKVRCNGQNDKTGLK